MHYVRVYFATFGISLIIAFVAYTFLPSSRSLFQEDSLVENLSALSFFSAFCLGILFLSKRKSSRKFLMFLSAFGLVGFLDELSFGSRIFYMPIPRIGGVGIDAVHDFFYVAYKYKLYVYPIVTICLLIAIFLARSWLSKLIKHPDQLFTQHYILIGCVFTLLLSASIIDLGIFSHHTFVMLEEMLEMNAGIALLFCCLSVPKKSVSHHLLD